MCFPKKKPGDGRPYPSSSAATRKVDSVFLYICMKLRKLKTSFYHNIWIDKSV